MKQTKYVYIVESGEYSDRSIEAVFLNKKKAEAFARVHNEVTDTSWYHAYVVEYELYDDRVDVTTPVREYHYAEISAFNGEIYSDENDTEKIQDKRDSYIDYTDGNSFITAYSVVSYEHALKIALDKYYEVKAEREGI